MTIPQVPFQREHAGLSASMHEALERVLSSGHWILGAEVLEFESEWSFICGTQHAVGVANGLDALEIALRAAGIGPGDEVITTPMTALATALAITRAGAIPVFADIDPRTALLDVESAARCVTDRTRAMIPVHLYGNASSARRWSEFAAANNIVLIEDCAQAHLARLDGKSVGTFGTAGAFSFYPTKNLGAVGDAGAIVTSNAAIAEQARMLRNYGQADRYHHPILGMNSRLDELQAAFLRVRLQMLEEQTTRRRQVAARLRASIVNPSIDLLEAPGDDLAHVHHLFVLLCDDREGLQKLLADRGVPSLIHYPVPAHLQPPYQGSRRDPEGLSRSERHAQRCLSVPCHPALEDAEVDRIAHAINEFSPRKPD